MVAWPVRTFVYYYYISLTSVIFFDFVDEFYTKAPNIISSYITLYFMHMLFATFIIIC